MLGQQLARALYCNAIAVPGVAVCLQQSGAGVTSYFATVFSSKEGSENSL
jgi:hypothetical protein